jgi:hypothetical protein
MKKQTIRTVLNALALTIITIVTVNFAGLIVSYFKLGRPVVSSFKYNDGLFWLNENKVGMGLAESKYWFFYAVLFAVFCYTAFKKNRAAASSESSKLQG